MKFFLVAYVALIFLEGAAFGFSVARSSRGVSSTSTTSSTRLDMAVWSDSKAVKDYQDFLASGLQEPESKSDGPSVIIRPREGNNELTDALVKMGMGDDMVLTPDDELPPNMGGNPEYPIYITLPPTQIKEFILNLSESNKERNENFIFFAGGFQYGNIEDVLKEYGYCRDSMTQVLITGMEVTSGKAIKDVTTNLGTDAMGADKLAGECTACGKWNGAVAERMERSEVRCKIDFYRDWRRKMWERNILDAVFNLVGAVRKEPTSIHNVATYYDEEVSDMVWQISQQLRGWKALTLTYGVEERMFGIAENTGSQVPCALIEEVYPHIWGNRVFTDSPLFLDYLWYAKENCGLLQSVELPNKRSAGADAAANNIMRQGNLRADGVI
jgi:hypothetical protein